MKIETLEIIQRVLFVTIVVLFIALVLVVTCAIAAKSHPKEGDMNSDGELTIVDLSILAEVIRNEP